MSQNQSQSSLVAHSLVDFGRQPVGEMVLTSFNGAGIGFGFGIGCGFGVGWGFGGMPMNFLGLGAGGGCGIGVGLGWGFGTAFGSQYRNSRVSFELHGSKAGAPDIITRKADADDNSN